MVNIGKLAKASLAGCLWVTASCTEPAPGTETTSANNSQIEEFAALHPATHAQFLHLSDIHFDPFYDSSLLPQLNAKSADQWESVFAGSTVKSLAGGSYQDTNYPLLLSMLKEAQKGSYDYILYTGDYLSHGFVGNLPKTLDGKPFDKTAFTTKTVDFINWMIAKYIPKTPLVAALGNNDSDCGDYNLTPGKDILSGVASDLPLVAADKSATSDFDKGGYYTIPHPTVANHDFVVLSIFWSEKYSEACPGTSSDPGGDQMTWLKGKLSSIASAKHRTTLLMHIPPGVDGFSGYRHGKHPRRHRQHNMWSAPAGYETSFETAVSGHSAIVAGAFAGHTHMDEFRVLSSETTPYLAVKMSPSVTPYNGNNPSFSVFTYDTTTGDPLDYTTTSLTSSYPGMKPANADWTGGYSFSGTYGYSAYSPANLAKLAAKIESDKGTQATWGSYYAAGASTPATRSWDVKYFGCALDEMNLPGYNKCLANWGS